MNAQLLRRAKQADILRAVNSQRVYALQKYQEDATGVLGMRLNSQYNNWANTWLRYHPPEIPSVRVVDTEVHENDEGEIVRVNALLSERKRQEAIEQRELSIQEKLNAILGDHNKQPSGKKPVPTDHFQPPEREPPSPPPTPSPPGDGDDDGGPPPSPDLMGHAGLGLDADTHGQVGIPPVNDLAAEHQGEREVKLDIDALNAWMTNPRFRGLAGPLDPQEGPSGQIVGSIRQGGPAADPPPPEIVKKEEEEAAEEEEGNIPIPLDVLNRERAFQEARSSQKERELAIQALETEVEVLVNMGADPTPILDEIRLERFAIHADRSRQGGELALQEMREAFVNAGEIARERMGAPVAREVQEATIQTETVANSVAIQAGTALQTTQAAVQAGLITREEGMQTEVEILQQATVDYEELVDRLEAQTKELELTQRQRDFLVERGRQAQEHIDTFRPRALEMLRVFGQTVFEDVRQRAQTDLSQAQERNTELNDALRSTGIELGQAQQRAQQLESQAHRRVQDLVDERAALRQQTRDLETRLQEAQSRAEGNIFVINDIRRLQGILAQREAQLQTTQSDLSAALERELFLQDSFQEQQSLLEETQRVAEREIVEARRLAAVQVEELRLQAQSAAAQAQRLTLALEEEQRQARAALLAEGQARQLQAQVQQEERAQLEQQLSEAQQRLQNRRRRQLRQGSRTRGPEFFGATPPKKQRRN